MLLLAASLSDIQFMIDRTEINFDGTMRFDLFGITHKNRSKYC